jgi:hypothetical protein
MHVVGRRHPVPGPWMLSVGVMRKARLAQGEAEACGRGRAGAWRE